MWVFRIEKPHRRPDQQPRPRFIDIEFAPHYSMSTTHLQRLATEFRVPMMQGFTMPSSNVCSETAAMYKLLLLHPLSVRGGDEPEDIRLLDAFRPMCAPPADGGVHRDIEGATAFTRTWIDFEERQHEDACLARARFLDRYEWRSV